MSRHPVTWLAPAPLWAGAAEGAAPGLRPAILRFASDEFMDEILGVLDRDPAGIGGLVARPETWRTRTPASDDLVERVPLPSIVRAARRLTAAVRPRRSAAPAPATAPSPAAADPEAANPAAADPLKLYQPAHQRYYLVAASLACAIPGLPDRAVVGSGTEQVGFVLRRLLRPTPNAAPADGLREFAFVGDGQAMRWQKVGDAAGDRLAPGEELLPLFPLAFRDDTGLGRTLLAGLIPVARREAYVGAGADWTPVDMPAAQIRAARGAPSPRTRSQSVQGRMTAFAMDVAEPWKTLIRASFAAREALNAAQPAGLSDSEPVDAKRSRVFFHNMQNQMQSWLILLDFARFLETYLPQLWDAIRPDGSGPDGLPTPQRRIYDWLGTARLSNPLIEALRVPGTTADLKPPATSLRDALSRFATDEAGDLERATGIYGAGTAAQDVWPGFHFPLCGLDTGLQCTGPFTALSTLGEPAAEEGVDADPATGATDAGQDAAAHLDRLTALVVRALPASSEDDAPPLPFALQLRDALAATGGDAGAFVVRCVYLNRECGSLHPPVLSAPTETFQLASFFDPDAPARPLRISLPLDTTPAGLRRHNRNTAFVISDVLCGQIQRAKGLGLGDLVRSVLPWPLHKDLDAGGAGPCRTGDGASIGMICSLSIPIITICALILLIVIVSLLDFIFRWLPYFIVCFPVRGLLGKPSRGA